MIKILSMICGVCAAATCLLIWAPRRRKPLEELAHSLEVAWADHHTIA
jgi:hypothetical protein